MYDFRSTTCFKSILIHDTSQLNMFKTLGLNPQTYTDYCNNIVFHRKL